VRWARVAALAFVSACVFAGVARGDGDPASDVLVKDRVFWPYYVKLPADSREALSNTVDEVTRNGFPVRVALIQHDYDLGSAGVLFRHPQDYAQFLAQELANFTRDWVIVVMPNGYGIYRCVPLKQPEGHIDPCEKRGATAADERVLRGLVPMERSKVDIAVAGEAAVRAVAERRGVSAGGGPPVPWLFGGLGVVVLAGVIGVLLLRRRRRRRVRA
jgi:hypothetical protein